MMPEIRFNKKCPVCGCVMAEGNKYCSMGCFLIDTRAKEAKDV